MKFALSSIILTAAPAVLAMPSRSVSTKEGWMPPGPNDVRAPCPMLNTLANHGFLPRTGRSISLPDVEAAFDHIGWDAKLANQSFSFALTTNPAYDPSSEDPDGGVTTFDLDHLTTHNILEHDASLSRADAYFGPADTFDAKAWAETSRYFSGPTITLEMAARGRTSRAVTSARTNPEFTISELGLNFQYGEVGAYMNTLGDDVEAGTAPKAFVDYLFQNEHLPYELGWTKNNVTYELSSGMRNVLVNITAEQMGVELEQLEQSSDTQRRDVARGVLASLPRRSGDGVEGMKGPHL